MITKDWSVFMASLAKKAAAGFMMMALLLPGCGQKLGPEGNKAGSTVLNATNTPPVAAATPTVAPTASPTPIPAVDLEKVKPNEAGKVMVVMFHNFVETFTPTASDPGEYTTTFNEFNKLLNTLYEKGYRLVNLNDFLNNNVNVPAGCVPMIFTFDDGTTGQFSLVEENGKLTANKNSAVGIMQEFHKKHPDFGLKGTFYVNLGNRTFEGKGTLAERLKYLADNGFEIGNHTYTHVSLPQVKSAEKIQQEIGGNQKKLQELLPGYSMTTFSLPYGQASNELKQYVIKGEFEGAKYDHQAIVEVGAGPTLSTVNKKSVPLSMSRVRATGMKAVQADMDWWLKNISRADEYVSDGNPNTVAVPKAKAADVDPERLKGKQLVTY